MNKQPTTFKPGALPRLYRATLITGILPAIFLLSTHSSDAGSATWKASPATKNWNTASNWTPATVPNGPSDTATFDFSNKTGVSLSATTEVNGIVFNAGASAFTITVVKAMQLTISGVGITNNSGITQNFAVAVGGGNIDFTNSATAGSLTAFTNNRGAMHFRESSTAGDGTFTTNGNGGFMDFSATSTAGNGTFTTNGGGQTRFLETSTAGNGSFTTNGSAVSGANPGLMYFLNASTAGNGTFTTNGGAVSGAAGGQVRFLNNSTADNGTFITNGGAASGAGGGFTFFFGTSTAGNGTFTANGAVSGAFGGQIEFIGESHGGMARVEVFGNGSLDISFHRAPGVTVGSIEGSGLVFLGANKLTVGSNNLSTTFSGVIQDGGNGGGVGGSLTKIGKGKLTLSKASTYTSGTTVSKGALLVKNKTGSGTGTGPVQVNAGTFGGTGIIAGAVTVGTGSGAGAFLSPGSSATKRGTLTINNNTLTFNSDATYKFDLNSGTATADKVVANGVTINSAQFSFADLGNSTLPTGTVFTVISNTAATPIAGTFSNLADGATFTNNGNSYKVNYQGGDGNDLTLKVVP